MLALIERILAILSTLLPLVDQIRGNTAKSAQERFPLELEGYASDTQHALNDGTSGLAAAHTERGALLSAVNAVRQDLTEPHLPTLADVLAALDPLVPPVSLPPVPPPGYGGAGADAAAAAVWASYVENYDPTNFHGDNESMYTAIREIETYTRIQAGLGGHPDPRVNDFLAVFADNWGYGAGHWLYYPNPSEPCPRDIEWASYQAGDTILSLLQRTQPAWFWTHTGPYGLSTPDVVWGRTGAGTTTPAWRCKWSERSIGIFAPPAAPIAAAPIWPGLSGVTLGAQVALADDMSLDGPMSGVLIHLTSVPAGRSAVGYNGENAWPKVCYLIFGSDSGHYEYPQVAGFEHGLYMPKTMSTAAVVKINTIPNIVGTVQPFTIP